MRLLKKHLFASLKKSSLFIFLLGLLIACNPSANETKVDPLPTSVGPPITETKSLFGTYLDTLELSIADYSVLRSTFPNTTSNKAKLVFQFYFNKDSSSNPSLIAYASRKKNQFKDGAVVTPVYKVLSIGGPNAYLLPDNFVLGDQQIRIDEIDGIISTNTDTLVFIPTIRAGEINVRYNVCIKVAGVVICLAPPPPTQPSPPADAK